MKYIRSLLVDHSANAYNSFFCFFITNFWLTISGLQANETVSVAYEHLARLSIYVEAARCGEMTAYDDPHHHDFEQLFHRLEVHQVGGLYRVMCRLSEVYRSLVGHQSDATVMEPDVVEEIRAIDVPGTRNHAERHLRDYAVATTVHRVAQRLTNDVQQLVEQYRQ